ncbi:MAG: F0F1 ATP synthase subunit delta, partial [Neisseriaceae bacterium]|nr:F0F1 ATP synthase subunit delta [Neisseriaceae bacterium]
MAEFATVARPYAKALYSLARQYDQTQVWGGDLALMAKIISEPKV